MKAKVSHSVPDVVSTFSVILEIIDQVNWSHVGLDPVDIDLGMAKGEGHPGSIWEHHPLQLKQRRI